MVILQSDEKSIACFCCVTVFLSLCRLQNTTAREQRNVDVINQLQQSSASHFSAMQSTFGSAVSSTQGFLQQSGTQLQSLMQLRHQEAEKVQARHTIYHFL